MKDYRYVPISLKKSPHVVLMTPTEWERTLDTKMQSGETRCLIRDNTIFPVKLITLTNQVKRRWGSIHNNLNFSRGYR